MSMGFSMVELLVSMLLTLTVSGAVLGVMFANTATSRTMSEVVDLQQRGRAAQEIITRDLYQAGAGADLGPAASALVQHFAPVLPRRAGLQSADAYNVARSDAITLISVPRTTVQTTLRAPLAAGGALRVSPWPNCRADPLCGLAIGAQLLVFDRLEHFDAFTVTSVTGDSAGLRSWQVSNAPFAYATDAVAVEAEWHTYYLDAAARQLRHFDGYLTDTPVVDDVVGVDFEYVGDPLPPLAPRPSVGAANCLYEASGAYRGGLSMLPADGGSLAILPLDLFRDGPWCGDGENRFDADLLRIRKVRVTLRLQAANEVMRGRKVADFSFSFEVAPRNMGLTR